MSEQPQPDTFTQSTTAALKYLLYPERSDGLDHLMAILWKSTRPLFIPNEFAAYKTVFHTDKVDEDGSKYTETRIEFENSDIDTRDWIYWWLRDTLRPYAELPKEKIFEAAQNDEFRHLGRKCRFALIDEVRHQSSLIGDIKVRTSLDQDFSEDADGDSLANYITVSASSNPKRPEDWIEDNKADLDLVDPLLYPGFKAFISAYVDSDYGTGAGGRVTRSLKEYFGVEDRQARNIKNKFIKLVREKYRHKPIVQQAYKNIVNFSDRYHEVKRGGSNRSPVACAVSESPVSKANRALLSESGKDMAEFMKWADHSPAVKKAVRMAESEVLAYDYCAEERLARPEELEQARFLMTGRSIAERTADAEAIRAIAEETCYESVDTDYYLEG